MNEEIVEGIEKNIKERTTMSKEFASQVNKRIFSNILIAVLILAYLIVVVLGSKNIENNIFIVALKVFSIILSLISILIFERSYKKSDGKLCIYGIEILLLAIMTLLGVYVFQIVKELFVPLICIIAIIVAIYYLAKSVGIHAKGKIEYAKIQSDIREIVKEELPETVQTKKRRTTLEAQMEEYKKLNQIYVEDEKDDDYKIEEDEELDDDDDLDDEIENYKKTNVRTIKTSSRKVEDREEDDEEEYDVFGDIKIITPAEKSQKNNKLKDSYDDLEEIKLVEKTIKPAQKKTQTTKSKTGTSSKRTKKAEAEAQVENQDSKSKEEPKEQIKEEPKKNTTKKKVEKQEEAKKETKKKTTSKTKKEGSKEEVKEEKVVENKNTTKKKTQTEEEKIEKPKKETAKKETTKKTETATKKNTTKSGKTSKTTKAKKINKIEE